MIPSSRGWSSRRYYSVADRNNQNNNNNNNNNNRSSGLNTWDTIVRPQQAVEQTWFHINEKLAEKRKQTDINKNNNNEIHFSFIEGPAGTGKQELLQRLNKLGYTIVRKPFFSCYSRYYHHPHQVTKE